MASSNTDREDENGLLQSTHYYGPSLVSGGTAIFGDNRGTIHIHQDETRLQRKQLLESWMFPEMNSRINEIKESHRKTFEWAFKQTLPKKSGNDLLRWLRDESGIFLIQGKAGSGKSTFIKFLTEHKTTNSLLQEWSPESPVLILLHSFWLPGTSLQHNMKGLLASLLFQLGSKDQGLVQICKDGFEYKRSLADWSIKELTRVLLELCAKTSFALCLFLDGLDEFDHEDDIDNLYMLLDNIQSSNRKFKICVSTRPIPHILTHFDDAPSLRLQDLTKDDIYMYATTTIESKIKKSRSSGQTIREVNSLAHEICRKAEGVFLWVYYVLQNVCKGLRIFDDMHALKRRIEKLPSAIEALYRQMWLAQNDDNEIHEAEAAAIFRFGEYFPMSVFQLAMAVDPSLRKTYLSALVPMGEKQLQNFCEDFEKRLSSRSAGLIECSTSKWRRRDFKEDTKTYRVGKTYERDSWRWKEAHYIHRTVQDFLTNTTEGAVIMKGVMQTSDSTVTRAFTESRLACFIEEITPLEIDNITTLVEEIAWSIISDVSLFTQVHAVCGALMRAALSEEQILAVEAHFVYPSCWQFAALINVIQQRELKRSFPQYIDLVALLMGQAKSEGFVTELLRTHGSDWSPYYKGYLFSFLTTFGWPHHDDDAHSWKLRVFILKSLLEAGADVDTPHLRPMRNGKGHRFESPAVHLLSTIFHDMLEDFFSADDVYVESLYALLDLIAHAKLMDKTLGITFDMRADYTLPSHKEAEPEDSTINLGGYVVYNASDVKDMIYRVLETSLLTKDEFVEKFRRLCILMEKTVYPTKYFHESRQWLWYEACTGSDALYLATCVLTHRGFGMHDRAGRMLPLFSSSKILDAPKILGIYNNTMTFDDEGSSDSDAGGRKPPLWTQHRVFMEYCKRLEREKTMSRTKQASTV